MSKQLRKESTWHLKAFSFSCPLWRSQKPLTVKSVCCFESSCFELITLMVINISSVWKTFLVVAFYSVWYFGSAWFFPPSHSQCFFFSSILIYYCVFDRQMSAILMEESYVSCNNEQPVTHRCFFVLQTKIYTNGTAQCQRSTDRRPRLWQIEAGMSVMLSKRLLCELGIRTCSCPTPTFNCFVSQFQT